VVETNQISTEGGPDPEEIAGTGGFRRDHLSRDQALEEGAKFRSGFAPKTAGFNMF